MEARKLVEDRKEREYVFQKWHVITPEIDEQKLRDVCDYWDDDYEAAFMKGIAVGFDDEIIFVEVDKLIDAIEEYIDDDDEEPEEYLLEVQKALEKYKGYTIWF